MRLSAVEDRPRRATFLLTKIQFRFSVGSVNRLTGQRRCNPHGLLLTPARPRSALTPVWHVSIKSPTADYRPIGKGPSCKRIALLAGILCLALHDLTLQRSACPERSRRVYGWPALRPRAIWRCQGGALSKVLRLDRQRYLVDSLCRKLEGRLDRCVDDFTYGGSVLSVPLAV